jgi:subtilase family serine protease
MIRIALIVAAILVSTAAALAQSPFYNQGRWRGGDQGAAIIGGMIGGAIGSMFAPRPYYQPAPAYYPPPQPYYQAPQYSDEQMYCMQRFRSYDPRSGYFTGYDNRLHPCP